MDDAQKRQLKSIVNDLHKKYGVESSNCVAITGNKNFAKVEWLPLDSPKQNDMIGNGYPRGRIIEIFGGYSSGKTSLACYAAGQVQKAGGIVGFIDFEQALDPEYAKTFGFNVDEAIIAQPSTGEEGLDIVEDLIEKQVDLIIVDSTAAITPAAELNGEMGDFTIGAVARLLSKACRKYTAKMSKSETILMFISQTRTAIGVYGNPDQATGGAALKFFSSVRIEVKKREPILNKAGEQIGMISRLKTVKNKVGAPMRVRDVKIIFGKGYMTDEEYMDYFVTYGVIKKSGAGWFEIPDVGSMQGVPKVQKYLDENPEIRIKWIEQVKTAMAGGSAMISLTSAEEALVEEVSESGLVHRNGEVEIPPEEAEKLERTEG